MSTGSVSDSASCRFASAWPFARSIVAAASPLAVTTLASALPCASATRCWAWICFWAGIALGLDVRPPRRVLVVGLGRVDVVVHVPGQPDDLVLARRRVDLLEGMWLDTNVHQHDLLSDGRHH